MPALSHQIRDLLEEIEAGTKGVTLSGLFGASKAFVLAELARQSPRPFLILSPTKKGAEALQADLHFFLKVRPQTPDPRSILNARTSSIPHRTSNTVGLFPEREEEVEVKSQRIACLKGLLGGDLSLIVASVAALLERLIPREALASSILSLYPQRIIAMEAVLQALTEGGYRNVRQVAERGEYSVRGGILDFFPPLSPNPIRVEFFGDEIVSLREFDPESQRSIRPIPRVSLLPISEVLLTREACDRAIKRLTARAFAQGMEIPPTLLTALRQGLPFPGMEAYLPDFYQETGTLFEYLPKGTLLVLDEPLELQIKAEEFLLSTLEEERKEAWALFPPFEERFLPLDVGRQIWGVGEGEGWEGARIRLETFAGPRPAEGPTLSFLTGSVPAYRGRIAQLVEDLQGLRKEGWVVHLVLRSEAQGRKLQEVLKEHDLFVPWGPVWTPGGIGILSGVLSSGFAFPPPPPPSPPAGREGMGFMYITESEIFGPRPLLTPKPKEAFPLPAIEALKAGDFVVHEEHGIGRFLGLQPLRAGGFTRDYLLIEYAEGARLYVPIDKFHLVHRYIGPDDKPPALDRLGGTSWARAKERVKASIRERAKELLELYAMRSVIQGFAFSPDTPWQREFEAAFPYEETPDQLKAIEEVKRDMERDRPMDRLVAGDVGYGKTEVALRAAFKAVMDGKQVAVLVPTTVLALQHFQTFSERFINFPVVVEILSRIRSRKEQQQVLRGLREGTVDIVIGTHRLLQDDVRFRDLGLLIVDEEHRFGVEAKERLKQLRREVDVLTLTATPIPRTLHMALLGLRDISTIETPPPERLSIKTVVARFDPHLIQEAIEKELHRGGQVFFVHNRIEDIPMIAKLLKELTPSAKIAVAHGELPEETLERIMADFYARKYDILLSTTIIEAGLDIPSANTIIIDRADRLGLAQLYQLRGRVGRDRQRAYAYLLVPSDEPLSELAKKRLQVIAELTELGSGFKVAARDLEIRGAGNLLGTEQHGHLSAVGFDLYCKLIEEAIREIKGEALEPPFEPTIRLPVEGYLPESYIEDPTIRLALYKRLTAFEQLDQVVELEKELLDRFGDLPEPARWLLRAVELKILARTLRIKEIDLRKAEIKIIFAENPPIEPKKAIQLLKASGIYRTIPSRTGREEDPPRDTSPPKT